MNTPLSRSLPMTLAIVFMIAASEQDDWKTLLLIFVGVVLICIAMRPEGDRI